MLIEIKKDENGVVGFLEKWSVYNYKQTTVVKALFSLGSLPYVYRNGVFDALNDVLRDYDLDSYMRSKKGVYSLVNEGTLILSVQHRVDEKGVQLNLVLHEPIGIENGYLFTNERMITLETLQNREALEGLHLGHLIGSDELVKQITPDRNRFLMDRMAFFGAEGDRDV